ncbi:peptidoglycan recognition protein [Antribacter sp. KLBMP9083]|uniref:Peptidoglycan recognition protein n=1 Tax=Antribacter soli TaxID=2910976 RepID=A0AA41U849_9MICO|nr:peptidoglycan recognition protein [Antribacter soli]MCF4120122.1 peptidoglycan recognition protein [Antribacter soli]
MSTDIHPPVAVAATLALVAALVALPVSAVQSSTAAAAAPAEASQPAAEDREAGVTHVDLAPGQGLAAAAGGTSIASAVVTGFATVGVTWHGPSEPSGLAIEVRTADADGSWSPWTALEAEAGIGGNGGTEPLVVGDVARVEARATGAGAAGVSDLTLAVVDPGSKPADAEVTAPPAASTPRGKSVSTGWPGTTGAPAIHSRAEWGADESIMTWPPAQGDIKAAVIHHTAGTNDYTPQDVPAILRGIYTYHSQSLNWGDIGYNFLVDKYGNVWEGRAGGIELETIGAHVSGYNTNTVGVSVMGNTSTATVTNEAVNAVVNLLAWKLSLHGVDAAATTTLNGNTLPTIFGHRDVASTECPGNTLWSRQGEIRSRVDAGQASYGSIWGQGTGAFVTGPGGGDIYLVSGTTKNRVTSMEVLTSLSSRLGRVSDASTTYVNYLTTGAELGWFVRDPRDGAISLVDAGNRYHAPSCAMIAAFGSACGGVDLTAGQWQLLSDGGGLSDAVKSTDASTVYVMRDGVRRPVTSWARLLELYGGTAPKILPLSPSTISAFPLGAAA